MAVDIRINFERFDGLGRPFGAEVILKELDRLRIEAAVLVPGMAVDADFRVGNAQLQEIVKSDARLYGYLAVNPAYPEESIEAMRAAMSSSKFVALGLLKGTSKPFPNLDDCRDLLNSFRRFAKPVFLQTPNAASIVAAAEMAQEFPGIKFILGCMGGADWRTCLAHAKQLNLILEASGSFDSDKIGMAVEAFGPHRVIFGSDFPYCDIPAMLALVQSSGISKEALTRVLGENAKALFGLSRVGAEGE